MHFSSNLNANEVRSRVHRSILVPSQRYCCCCCCCCYNYCYYSITILQLLTFSVSMGRSQETFPGFWGFRFLSICSIVSLSPIEMSEILEGNSIQRFISYITWLTIDFDSFDSCCWFHGSNSSCSWSLDIYSFLDLKKTLRGTKV